MDIEKEMKKLRKGGPGSLPLPKMAKLLATMLDKAAIGWTGKVFYNRKFRKLAEFEKLQQLEKDRIFNELVIAPLVLLMMTLEAPDLRQSDDFRDYLLAVRDEIPKAHIEYLKTLGIEKKHLKDWNKLIEMRYQEYSQDKLEARQAMIESESRKKEIAVPDLDNIHLFLPAFTVAVGCHKHICRGKTKGKDKLFKYLIKNLSRFYTKFRLTAEGGRITPLKRLGVKLHHLWNDLRDR